MGFVGAKGFMVTFCVYMCVCAYVHQPISHKEDVGYRDVL
jgi:hypothetical protein